MRAGELVRSIVFAAVFASGAATVVVWEGPPAFAIRGFFSAETKTRSDGVLKLIFRLRVGAPLQIVNNGLQIKRENAADN